MKLSIVGTEELGTREIGKILAKHRKVPFLDCHTLLADMAGPNIFPADEIDPAILKTLSELYKEYAGIFATIPNMIVNTENLNRLHDFGPIVYLKPLKNHKTTNNEKKVPKDLSSAIETACRDKIDLVLPFDGDSPNVISQKIIDIFQPSEHSILLPPDRKIQLL